MIRENLRFFYLSLIFISISAPASALTTAEQQRAISKNIQQERRIESERQNETRIREKEDNQKAQEPDLGPYCFLPTAIKTSGNKALSAEFIKQKFLNQLLGRCVNAADIRNIQKEISNYYKNIGYKNIQAYFDMELLQRHKIMSLVIAEGQNFNQEISKIAPGKTVDQYKKSANPNIDKHKTNITLAYDNSGQYSTGKHKKSAALSQDNLLNLQDNIYLKYKRDDENDEHDRYSKNFYSAFSIPLGLWKIYAGYSQSSFLSTGQASDGEYKSSGNTYLQNYGLSRNVKSTKSYKSKLGAELNLRNTKSYINEAEIATSSRKLTTMNLFYDHLFFNDQQSFFIKPSYQKGLDLFGAKQDNASTAYNSPHAQYQALKLSGYYDTNFKLPKTDLPLNYVLSFDSQYSFDSLYGSEQFGIGGLYTVRGFDENSISGDSGYFLRNDLKTNLVNLVPASLNKGFLDKTYVGIFYDYGYVRNKFYSQTGKGYMSGTGGLIGYKGDNVKWNVTYSKALNSPKFIQNVYGESNDNETIYFNVALALGFF